jgi:probable addiction module antidote protein
MKKPTLEPWDSTAHLLTPEDRAAYLDACLAEAGDDPLFIAKALGNIARAAGMTQISRQTGLDRENLYRALSGENNPSFVTIARVAAALGIRFRAEPIPET